MSDRDTSRSSDPKPEDIDRIIEAFVYLYTESRRDTKTLARQHGLTGPQVTALKLLESVGELSLTALSSRMQARNSTITGIVGRMRKQGLVERTRDPRDGRVGIIRLTPEGQTLAEQLPIEPMQMFASVLKALSATDRGHLVRILGAMSAHVQRLAEGRDHRVPAQRTPPLSARQPKTLTLAASDETRDTGED